MACDIVIVVVAVRVWYDVKQAMPPVDETVRIVAQQWAWSFVHAGADGRLDTADDIKTVDDLHLQIDKTYRYELASRDVLHALSIPVFRLKQDAIPGRVISGWFRPTKTGTWDLQCAEICGIGHGLMPARVLIETPEQHAAWIASQTATGSGE
jgi:cytochrome c oxidase subunit 2